MISVREIWQCAGLGVVLCLATASPAVTAAEPCKAGKAQQTVTLTISDSGAQLPVSMVASITYDPNLVRLAEPLRKRLHARAGGAMIAPKDTGGTLRIVAGKGGGLAAGPLVDIAFDRCAGARAPAAEDFRCSVDSCAGSGGAIGDCTCSVTP
ncbi:MAG: hypothetical protein ABI629_01820 [bacterium]